MLRRDAEAGRKAEESQTRRTVLAGLVGRGIQLSRTPAMHEAEGKALGLRYVYRLLDTERMEPNPPEIAEMLRVAEICGFSGLNITYPYKIEVIEHLDELSDAARTVGAVNTVVLRDGRRNGHNTDVWGFAESFRRNMSDVSRDRVLLLGAGGAGVAVAQALMQCEIGGLIVYDKEPDKAQELAGRLNTRFGLDRVVAVDDIAGVEKRVDGIVNATPVGMNSLPGTPIPGALPAPPLWVADIIYFPIETELLRAARAAGCRTMPGSDMAVFQAVRAFELITGLVPDPARMMTAFETFEK